MEKPILFSTPMVQAILAGRKTMTRRVIKKKYENTDIQWFTNKYGTRLVEMQNDAPLDVYNPETKTTTSYLKGCAEITQPWQVGDILWVRETWYTPCNEKDCNEYKSCREGCNSLDDFYYKADKFPEGCVEPKWRPSIFMPREAARLFLKVKNILVERLQDITENDVRREGFRDSFDPLSDTFYPCGYHFVETWNNLNVKRGYGWDLNPWVWVIEFEMCEKVGNTNS